MLTVILVSVVTTGSFRCRILEMTGQVPLDKWTQVLDSSIVTSGTRGSFVPAEDHDTVIQEQT
jgi:hypothetical protein